MIETKIHTPIDTITPSQPAVELPQAPALIELETDERTSGERIRDEFSSLWNIYKGRRDGLTLHMKSLSMNLAKYQYYVVAMLTPHGIALRMQKHKIVYMSFSTV